MDQIDNLNGYIALDDMTFQQLHYVVALDDHQHFMTAEAFCFVTNPH